MRFDLSAAPWALTAHPTQPGHDLPPALSQALAAGVPATVPGSVHTDLLAAGLIEDPYALGAEPRLLWIAHTDWTYTTTFALDPDALNHDRLELACDGLDTVAALHLNGQPIGHAANMHRRHRFDLKAAARAGTNTLSLRFRAPIPAAEEAQAQLGALPHEGHGGNTLKPPHNAIRKMACSYGWDWGPVLPSAGIWRAIAVDAWSTARIADLRPAVVQATEHHATIELAVDLHRASHAPIAATATLTDPQGQPAAAVDLSIHDTQATATLHVPKPQRWWPVGHGDQPRYSLTVTLSKPNDATPLHTTTARIGLRTITLDTTADPAPGNGAAVEGLPTGEQMTLLINDQPVFLKGANWIPDDCFPARSETPTRLRQRIDQLIAAHGNCLRIWGGGVYPSADFLDHCDARGVLVWQDFMFACAGYPEEAPYAAQIEAEARDNLARLCPHPSVVLYNGNNECIWATFDWGDEFRSLRDPNNPRGFGLHYWLDLLPRLVAELDPSRPYWPASPYSGSMDHHPNQNERGNRHIWNVWHGDGQYRNYLGHYPRMATEFGYHGPPHAATLLPRVPQDQHTWNSPALEYYNRNGGLGGQQHTDHRLADDFIPPHDNLDDWLYLAQLMQARALEMGCTWFRALSPWCSAALYWQWNDCWPVSSWSAIDGAGREKPLYHATRRFFAPRLITIKPQRPVPEGQPIGPLAVYLHNDTPTPWTGPLTAQRVDLHGHPVDTVELQANVPPRALHRIDLPQAWPTRPTDPALVVQELCDASAQTTPATSHAPAPAAWWWFAPDKDLAYPPAKLDVQITSSDAHTHNITLTAHTLIRDLHLFPDRLHPSATVSDNGFTLLPGDTTTLTLHCPVAVDPAALSAAPIMQFVNRFGKTGAE